MGYDIKVIRRSWLRDHMIDRGSTVVAEVGEQADEHCTIEAEWKIADRQTAEHAFPLLRSICVVRFQTSGIRAASKHRAKRSAEKRGKHLQELRKHATKTAEYALLRSI